MDSPLRSPLVRRPRDATRGLWLIPMILAAATLQVGAQQTVEEPAKSAWLDLRPALPGAAPQTVPAWVEAIEFQPAIPGDVNPDGATDSRLPATFRLRVHRPAGVAGDDPLLLRLFFRDGPGPSALPRVTAWDELGHRLLDSGPIGEGLAGALGSSEGLTVPMAGVNYLEINAPDETAVRGAQLLWLQRREIQEPADFPAAITGEPERARELRMVAAAAGREATDGCRYGTVTAKLQPGRVSLVGAGANSQHPGGLLLDFELERVPLAALLTFEILSDAPVSAPPEVFINGRPVGAASLQLPDLDDPGYQGEAASGSPIATTAVLGNPVPGPLRFRYTGWLPARELIPAGALRPGVNRLLIQLSNDVAAGAVRAVDLQLKYPWEKLDYVVPLNTNNSSR